MKMTWKAPPIFLVVILFLSASPADSMVELLSFDETVQNADVIFVGKAIDQKSRSWKNDKMIFTDVSFQVEKVIYSNQMLSGDAIELTFAGGKVGEKTIMVSDVPTIETGQRYVIFTLMDGKTYASPVIGYYQGLFQVVTDEVTGESYPVTYGGKRAIAGFDDRYILPGMPVNRIRGGVIEEVQAIERAKYHNVAPEPVAGPDMGKLKASVAPPPKPVPGKILNLDEFIGEIKKRLADKRGVMQ